MATITSNIRRQEKKKVSATYLQKIMFLVFGLLLLCIGYTSFCIGLTLGETYNELEEDTYNPNILIKWSHYPTGWETMSYIEIRKHFKCRHHGHDQTKPIPTLDDWSIFRQHYKDIVDPNASFDEAVPPTEGYVHDELGILHHTTLKNPKGKVEVSLHRVI